MGLMALMVRGMVMVILPCIYDDEDDDGDEGDDDE